MLKCVLALGDEIIVIPEMVPARQAFKTCPENIVSIVCAKLDGLVNSTIPISQISTLRVTKVEAKALFRANSRKQAAFERASCEMR